MDKKENVEIKFNKPRIRNINIRRRNNLENSIKYENSEESSVIKEHQVKKNLTFIENEIDEDCETFKVKRSKKRRDIVARFKARNLINNAKDQDVDNKNSMEESIIENTESNLKIPDESEIYFAKKKRENARKLLTKDYIPINDINYDINNINEYIGYNNMTCNSDNVNRSSEDENIVEMIGIDKSSKI